MPTRWQSQQRAEDPSQSDDRKRREAHQAGSGAAVRQGMSVFSSVVAGTDTVITVRDLKRPTSEQITADQQDRRQYPSSLDLGQVRGDVRIVDRKERQSRGAQDVLGLLLPRRRPMQSLDERRDTPLIRQKRQILRRRREVVIIWRALPLWLVVLHTLILSRPDWMHQVSGAPDQVTFFGVRVSAPTHQRVSSEILRSLR